MMHRMVPLLGIVMLGVGVAVVGQAVAEQGPAHVAAQLGRIPLWRLGLAAAFSATGYAILTGFDLLGIRWCGRTLAYPRVALASFTSLSLGHNIGLGGLGSGTLRYRFYSAWGIRLPDVARIVFFSGLTVLLGLVTLGGVSLLLVPESLGLSRAAGAIGGIACLASIVAYLVLGAVVRGPVGIGHWHIRLPHPRVGAAQVLLGVSNYVVEAAVLHQLLAAFADPGYLAVLSVYVVAILAGLLSHSPGGLGIIEAVVLGLLPGEDVVPALLAYRALYYWIPGLAGAALLAAFEWHRRHRASFRAQPTPA